MVTGSGMFRGVERSGTVRQHQESWQLQDTQWKGCVLLSSCRAEPSAAREAGHEEHTNLSNLGSLLSEEEAWTSATAPGSPGQHW